MTLALAAMTWVIVTTWPDGSTSRDPATTLVACEDAARAWLAGRALPLDVPGPAVSARCEPGNLFKPGYDCIQGYNCRGDRG